MKLPEHIWSIYKQLQHAKIAVIKLDSHYDFLSTCKQDNLIPKGLQHKCKINYEPIKQFSQSLLNNVSFKVINRTLKWMKREIYQKNQKINQLLHKLNQVTFGEQRENLHFTLDNKVNKLKFKLNLVKQKKVGDI